MSHHRHQQKVGQQLVYATYLIVMFICLRDMYNFKWTKYTKWNDHYS